jgi:excisionase family DNA binding protein
MSTPGPTVDITQAAELMKVHPKTVLDKINSGELAAGKVGRAYVFMTKDVLALIEHEIISQTAKRMGTPQRHQSLAARSLPRKLA